MGKIDTLTKEYMKRPTIFADVFNQFLYHGQQVIKPDRLVELDTTEIAVPYGTDQVPVPEQRYRDVAKMLMAMTDGKVAYCILAVENEAKIHYAVPSKTDYMISYSLRTKWQRHPNLIKSQNPRNTNHRETNF